MIEEAGDLPGSCLKWLPLNPAFPLHSWAQQNTYYMLRRAYTATISRSSAAARQFAKPVPDPVSREAQMPAGVFKHIMGTAGSSGFGSRSTAEQVSEGISLKDRTAIVTGATAGIGVETARVLALRGATVVVAARNLAKAEGVKAEIEKKDPNAKVEVRELDLGSFASVRKFAAAFKAENRPLNLLINNAGYVTSKFQLSEDGYESIFATNYLGHFLLTDLLLDNLVATAKDTGVEGRIVIVASDAHGNFSNSRIPFNDINNPNRFEPMNAYAQSKVANILHGRELARRLKEQGANVTVNSLHPGYIATNIMDEIFSPAAKAAFQIAGAAMMKSVKQGAATSVYVATSPSLRGVSGKYFENCNESETASGLTRDMGAAAELWEFSKKVVQV